MVKRGRIHDDIDWKSYKQWVHQHTVEDYVMKQCAVNQTGTQCTDYTYWHPNEPIDQVKNEDQSIHRRTSTTLANENNV